MRLGGVIVALLAASVLIGALASRYKRTRNRATAALAPPKRRMPQQQPDRAAQLASLVTHLQDTREQERAHVARQLHDELGALLTAAKLDVARLKSRLGPDATDLAQRLQHLAETLNSGIALKRRIIEELRPSSLSNLGLTASLEILAGEVADRSGVQVSTTIDTVALDESLQLTAYRVVQESLANMVRHSQARHAEVTVRPAGGDVVIGVDDDGTGFDPHHPGPAKHGLAAIRHRVEAAGGRLHIGARPGGGTRVVALLPALAAAD